MITYKTDYTFTKEQVQRLFLSVEWHSGNYPDLLYKALNNYPTVVSAYDGDKLVGMVATMDDGCMNAYVHYVLVDPEYQGYGIGRKLMQINDEKYKDYINVVLIAYNNAIKFYKSLNYKINDDALPMLK